MKHLICYSGGHSSAIVAIEVSRKYGTKDLLLVNHECKLEPDDVARFENEVADYLNVPITYYSMVDADKKDQFDVVMEAGSFINPNGRQILCTSRMKTEPFNEFLKTITDDVIIYYGFDAKETSRIQRRSTILAAQGYRTDYPLIWKDRTIFSTREIGIEPPNSYAKYKHGNCKGCLKAGWQHWYIIYVDEPEIYAKGEEAERAIGYSMHNDYYLEDMRPRFEAMVRAGIEPTEHIAQQAFWARVRKRLKGFNEIDLFSSAKPCECFV